MLFRSLFSLVLLLGAGDYLVYAVINFVTGLFAPTISILGPSMAADVIDEDHLASGEQRGALFMAVWAMTEKLAVAVAAVITLALAQSLGFDPAAQQDPASLQALKISFCVLPNVFFLMSIVLIWNYPLGHAELGTVRAALAARGQSSVP